MLYQTVPLLFFACVPLTVVQGHLVHLSYGTFQGASDGNITKFLGVPFARPTGRFELPQPPLHLLGIQNATAFGPACPQQALSPVPIAMPNYTHISEACLILNVFAPASARPGSKLPVLVWLYGGGFEFGDSAQIDLRPTVERSIILGEPVLIVASNYRLSAFGFLAGQEVGDAGISNLGLRDQIFALEWVQKYIHKFGGDPNRVVLGGWSAGATSTGTLLLENKHKTNSLFHGAASGSPSPLATMEEGQPDFDALVTANNCTNAYDTLECLRRVPFEAFLFTVDKTPDIFSFRSLDIVWSPRIDRDIILRDPIASVTKNAFAKIPVMIGDVDDEGTLFAFSSLNITTEMEFIDYVRAIGLPETSQHLSRIAELYPQDPARGAPFSTGRANQVTSEFKRIAAFIGDQAMVSLRRLFLRYASKSQHAWSWLSKRGKSTPNLGAFHGTDLPLFFPLNATTAAMKDTGVDYLINFINTLDPNQSAAPKPYTATPSIFWPKWNTSSADGSSSLLTFLDTAGIAVTADTFRSDAIDFLISLLLEGTDLPSLDGVFDDTTQTYLGSSL